MDGFNRSKNGSRSKDFWDDEFGDDLILEVSQDTQKTSNPGMTNVRNVMERNDMEALLDDDDMDFESLVTSTAIPNSACCNQLTNELGYAKRERDKSRQQVIDLQKKLESMTGENAVLRSTIHNLKEQMHALKVQRIMEANAQRQEHQTEVEKLTKHAETKNTELRLKLLQCSNVCNSNRPASPKPLHKDTERPGSKRKAYDTEEEEKDTRQCMQHKKNSMLDSFWCLHDLHVQWDTLCLTEIELDDLEDKNALMQLSCANRIKIFREELESVYSLLLRSVHKQLQDQDQLVESCVNSVYSALSKFNTYITSIELPPIEKKPIKTANAGDRPSVNHGIKWYACTYEPFQKSKASKGKIRYPDRVVAFKEYLNVLSVLCKQRMFADSLVDSILRENITQEKLASAMAAELVSNIYSTRGDIIYYYDILEELGLWLRNLLQHSSVIKKLKMAELFPLISILRRLILIPSPSIHLMFRLSECFTQFSKLPNVLTLLCPNNEKPQGGQSNTTKTLSDENQCCLATYVYHIRATFTYCSHSMQFEEFEEVAKMGFNHLKFIYFCLTESTKFIGLLEPVIDEHGEEKSSQNTSETKMQMQCECYISLCLSVITVMYTVLCQWLDHRDSYSRLELPTSYVMLMAEFFIHISYQLFCAHYVTYMQRESEERTKYQMDMICKCLLENSNNLELSKPNVDLLVQIQKSPMVLLDLTYEKNLSNIQQDLLEWERMTGEHIEYNEAQREECLRTFEENLKNFKLEFRSIDDLLD